MSEKRKFRNDDQGAAQRMEVRHCHRSVGTADYMTSAYQFRDMDHAKSSSAWLKRDIFTPGFPTLLYPLSKRGSTRLREGADVLRFVRAVCIYPSRRRLCSKGDNMVVSRKIYGGTYPYAERFRGSASKRYLLTATIPARWNRR